MINKFLYPNGGSETYIFKLGDYLKSQGHEVQYFGMEHEGRCVGNRVNAYTSNMDFHGGSKLAKLTYLFKTIYSRSPEKAAPCFGQFPAGCLPPEQCWVSRSVRGLVVSKIHGIWGVAGQSRRVSGDLSERISATYQGWRAPETMYFWHFKTVDYRINCPNGTSRVTSISWYVQSGRSSRLSIRLSAGENMISGWMSNT